MLDVEEQCRRLIPEDTGPHLAVRVKAKYRAWRERSEIETRIFRLREQVRGCYDHFIVCDSILVIFFASSYK